MLQHHRFYTTIRQTGLITCLLFMAACSGKLAEITKLKQAEISNDPFFRTLAEGYLSYAEMRDDALDFHSASHFAEKGLLAAYDTPVPPEQPSDWTIAPQQAQGLTFSRNRLIMLLAHPQIDKEPVLAAETQLAFDCWLDQQSGADNLPIMQRCQQGYFEHYARLKAALDGHAEKEATALEAIRQAELEAARLAEEEAARTAEEAKGEQVQSTSAIIYFPFDSAVPLKAARALLDEVIHYIITTNPSEVIIHGHTDRAGSEHYNLHLSERRAAYVRSRLVEAGVKDDHISHYGFGESDPKEDTEDGVRNAANRRVEIFIE